MIRAGNCKVIDLPAQEYGFGTKLVGDVNVALIGGGAEAKFRRSKDAVNMLFPEMAALGMTLESVTNGNDYGTVQSDTIPGKIPFSEDVVNGKESRDRGAGGVGVGILSAASEDRVVE